MIGDLFDTAKEWGFDQLRDTSLGIVESMLALSMVALNPLFPAIATPLAGSFRLLVMGAYGLAVCIGGIVVMTSETLQERYSAREIVPRLIAGFMLCYFWSTIIWFVQDLNIEIVTAFTLGEVMGDSAEGADFLDLLEIEARTAPISLIDLFVGLLKLVAAFVLWLCMLTRDVAWFIVAVFAPIALGTHALPFTEGLAWMWWRMLWACFFSSVGQAALIWVWMNIYTHLDDIEVLAYYGLGPFYMLVLTWVAWRLHKDLFIWAKGSPMRLPGSRLAKAVVGTAVGIAVFRWNPVGRLAGLIWNRLRSHRGDRQQTPIPPAPPPPPGHGPQAPGPRLGPHPRPGPPKPNRPKPGGPPPAPGEGGPDPTPRPDPAPDGGKQSPGTENRSEPGAGPGRPGPTSASSDTPADRPKTPPTETITPSHRTRPATTSPAPEHGSRWDRLRRRPRITTIAPEDRPTRPGPKRRTDPGRPIVIEPDPPDGPEPRGKRP